MTRLQFPSPLARLVALAALLLTPGLGLAQGKDAARAGGKAASAAPAAKAAPAAPAAKAAPAAPAAKAAPAAPAAKAAPAAAGGVKGRVVERVIAVVNDDIILLSELRERVAPIVAEMERQGELSGRNRDAQLLLIRRRMLDLLVDERLMMIQAQQLKLGVTSEEIDRALAEIRKQNNVDMDDLIKALRQQGMTLAQYRQDLRKQILRLKVVNASVRAKISVSDDEVRTYYDQNVRKAGTQRTVRASHIYIAIPDGASPQEVARRRRLAGDLVERARGGADFAKLAREYSEDAATKNEGGDLGYFTRGSLPPAVEEIVFNMDVGDVRGPIRAARGFHVIKLLARKDEGVKPYDQVKEQLRQRLYSQEMEKATRAWLQELRKKAHVELRM
jgi:peptidyl-prolyl cis-trans isomerase SurA